MAQTRKPELIYVVEDEAAIARLIADTLEKFSFRTELFRTAEAFFHGLRHQVPELVVLDLGLPDMDGMAVLQQLRRKHTCGLLVVTGRADTHDRVMGLELGADDYVVKPFEPRELIARVRSILRRYPGQVVLPADPAQRVAEFAGWRFAPGSNTLTSPSGQLGFGGAAGPPQPHPHPRTAPRRPRRVGAGPQHRPARLASASALRGRPAARQTDQDGVRRRLPAGGDGSVVLKGYPACGKWSQGRCCR